MKIVIDSKIPFIHGFAELLGDVSYIDGADIKAENVRDADVLIIRTRTHCNSKLLGNSKVRFIATATIGYDHLDVDFLKKSGIKWTNCPGCNASSVAQYIQNSLLLLAAHGCWENNHTITPPNTLVKKLDYDVFKNLTLGIVGVGHVGTQILLMAKKLGFKRIILCDPPRAKREKNYEIFSTLNELACNSDIITFHTPLTYKGKNTEYPTYHLADENFFSKLRRGAVIINTSRGEVIKTETLKHTLKAGKVRAAIIDTWENEPFIDQELLHMAFIATPHIAGYSADGKSNSTCMALKSVAIFLEKDFSPFEKICPPSLPPNFFYYPEGSGWKIADELRLYDPTRDSLALKENPYYFERLRNNYPLRREHY